MSVRRSAATFGAATVLGHLSQLVWLAAGSRAMSPVTFGKVLAAQALYAVLQILIDVGTATLGARTVARGELTDEKRGKLVRIRMTLVLVAAAFALAFGALGVSGSLAATAPFIVALLFFGALNVWVPYGGRDARPMAAYIFIRSALPAMVATAYIVLGAGFPAPLAGLIECGALIFVMVLFGQRPLCDLRLALAARGGPWRATLQIGTPPLMGQMSVAAGVFILSGAGSPAAAGVLAACVRLLTGLNAINGIIATAMYPRLSQIAVAGTGADTALTALALRLIALVGAVATAVCVLAGDTLINAFIGVDSGRAATALVMTTAASLPLGSIIMYSYQLVARGNERDSLVPFGIGAGTTIGCGVFAVILFGPRVDLVAGTLLAGQLLGTAILARRVARRCPEIAGAAARSMRIALLVALLALGSLVDGWALPAGLLLGGLVVTMLAGFLPMAGRLLSGRG